MENASKLYFTKEQLANTPSRKCGIDANKELSYRQQAANFIQDMGQRLQVSQLCINTAIVYMHRFYVFHSFSEVHRNSLSVAALFLAAKVEEQPRKLEHVIKVAHVCLHKDSPQLDVRTDAYLEKQFEVVAHENVLLQTLGFVLAIEHPHTYVVKVCQLVKASKDLAQTSYFMATTSLHMTTMCLQYKPTLVACVCIHLACKWSSWRIEPCSEGKEWYYYVDKSVTLELLETLTQEFIAILETSPHRFKRKFMAQKDGNYHGSKSVMDETFGNSKHHSLNSESRIGIAKKDSSPGPSTSLSFNLCSEEEKPQVRSENPKSPHAKKEKPEPTHSISLESYREKREKERLEQKVEAPLKPSAEQMHKVLPDIKHPKVVHPTSNKVNHVLPKGSSENKLCFSTKSSVNNEPVVLLERVTVKTEPKDVPPVSEMTVPRPPLEGAVVYHKHSEGIHPIKVEPLHSSKPKHQKYKANSLHNSHERSPAKTNGSKEGARARQENSEASRHERRERHKSKHSGRSSKEKPLNNHTSAEPIKVKIRKDIIRLPEAAAEPPKPGIKIKLKPPVPEPTPLKLVFKKDKSGSGSYSASQRQNESRKRSHSPSVRDSVKRPHHDSSKSNRHRSNHMDMLDDGASYGNSNNIPMDMYGYKQFYPYQITPPPPPPPIPPPLIAPPLPPQPPPPPPQ